VANTVQDQTLAYQAVLERIVGPGLELVNKHLAHQLPYRWELRTKVEPIRYVATIEFSTDDIPSLNGKNEHEQREYLRARFAHRRASADIRGELQ
jgi:hypothetical protein